MIYWAQLFHFYQPPTQLPSVLNKICQESYRPLIEVFRQHPSAKATFNINGVLTEMLSDHGQNDIIEGLKELAEKGQIEFTGSAKYHPILPLIPPEESRRQIEINKTANAFYFGKKAFKPSGFFPPEMAYSRAVLPAVIATGHQWIILSGVACPADWPVDKVYQIEHDGKRLAVFFRDDILSNKISFHELGPGDFLNHLRACKGEKENVYVVTAMDAETYGHHIKHWEELFLGEVYAELEIKRETYSEIKQRTALAHEATKLIDETVEQVDTVTIGQLLSLFPAGEVIDPKPSSWSTTAQDINAGNPYPLWDDKGNEIHRLLWEHLQIVMEISKKALESADNDESKHFANIARGLQDRALQSDQFWWASRRPMWDINLIHMGLIDQWRVILNAYRALNVSGASGDIKRDCYHKLAAARDIRNKITDRLFVL
jgi:alpha-amylase/alpha-mannosidase (GH57 family)